MSNEYKDWVVTSLQDIMFYIEDSKKNFEDIACLSKQFLIIESAVDCWNRLTKITSREDYPSDRTSIIYSDEIKRLMYEIKPYIYTRAYDCFSYIVENSNQKEVIEIAELGKRHFLTYFDVDDFKEERELDELEFDEW